MDLQLQGKKAIVSGGSRGIGKAIAFQLAREGADVAIGARSDGPLQETVKEIAAATGRKIVGHTVNTLDLESIKAFVLTGGWWPAGDRCRAHRQGHRRGVALALFADSTAPVVFVTVPGAEPVTCTEKLQGEPTGSCRRQGSRSASPGRQ